MIEAFEVTPDDAKVLMRFLEAAKAVFGAGIAHYEHRETLLAGLRAGYRLEMHVRLLSDVVVACTAAKPDGSEQMTLFELTVPEGQPLAPDSMH
jgi:hypothetical protein